tara:strand:+ start:88 stop:951 length:864 start_codon:yes stop_codon:yes gene_type:complete
MEQNNIIFLVIILLVILYGCERILLFTRENFTDNIMIKKPEPSCNNEKYIINSLDHETISIKKGDYLKNIVNKLIVELNIRTELKFKFLEFEHVTEQIFNDGVKRYIIDFFIHEIDNYYDKRLILDIHIVGNEGIVKNLTIGNGKKETIDIMKVNHYNFDHTIISDDNLKLSNIIKGFNNSTLDFGVTDLKNSMERNRNFKAWIEPTEKKTGPEKTWPCREQSIWWDENGVNDTQNPNTNCEGINSSYSPSLKVAQFRPSHKNRKDGDNDWVFSNYLQIGSDLSILS